MTSEAEAGVLEATDGDFLVDLEVDVAGGLGAGAADGAMVSLSPIEAALLFFFAIAQAKGVVASEDKMCSQGRVKCLQHHPEIPRWECGGGWRMRQG
jgi:hypothetical protein